MKYPAAIVISVVWICIKLFINQCYFCPLCETWQSLSVCSGDSISAAMLGCHHLRRDFTWWPRNGVKHSSSSTLQTSSLLRRIWRLLWVTSLRQQMQIPCVHSTWVVPGSHHLPSGTQCVVYPLNLTSPNIPVNYEPTLSRSSLQAYRINHESGIHICKSEYCRSFKGFHKK